MTALSTSEKLKLAVKMGIKMPALMKFVSKEAAEEHTAENNKELVELSDGLYMEKLHGITVKIMATWTGERWENYMVVITQSTLGKGDNFRKEDLMTCSYNVHHKNFAAKYFDKIKDWAVIGQPVLLSFIRFKGEYYYNDILLPEFTPYIKSILKVNGSLTEKRVRKGFYTSVTVFDTTKPLLEGAKVAYGHAKTIKESFRKCYEKINKTPVHNMLYRRDGGVYECKWYYTMKEDESLTRNYISRKEKRHGNDGGGTGKRRMDSDSKRIVRSAESV